MTGPPVPLDSAAGGRAQAAPHDGERGRMLTLKDQIADSLRERIFRGELRPGQKIDQDQVADEFGVSRLPVREALFALQSESLVEYPPRRGAYVAQLTRDDIRDHFEISGAIWAIAAEHAASRLTPGEVDRLQALVDEAQATDPATRPPLNQSFDAIILDAGASRRLRTALEQLSQTIPTRFFDLLQGWEATAHADHLRLVAAFRAGDAKAAAAAMRAHVSGAGAHVVRLLEERGFWDRREQGG